MASQGKYSGLSWRGRPLDRGMYPRAHGLPPKKSYKVVKAVVPRSGRKAKIPMKYIPQQLIPETKYFDLNVNNAAIGTLASGGATYQLIAGIVQGTAEGQRAGDSIFLRRIVWRGIIEGNASIAGGWLRVCIVKDTKPNIVTSATPATMGQVLLSAGGDTERDLMSFTQPTNGGRFRIVKQRWLYLPTYLGTATTASPTAYTMQATQRILQFNVKVNKKIEYENTNNAPCSNCNYYLMMCSNLTSNQPRVVWNSRAYYTDA